MHSYRVLVRSPKLVSTRNLLRPQAAKASVIKHPITHRLLTHNHHHKRSHLYLTPSILPHLPDRRFPGSHTQMLHSAAMANMDRLTDTLHPGVPSEVLSLWFNHITSSEQLILPPNEARIKWFRGDPGFDKACISKFGPYLTTISSVRPTASELLSTISPLSALDWLGLVILLDQISRNVFRGAEARTVYETFDPLAQEVTDRAISAGVLEDPVVKYRLAYRAWFCMPFMHSESREVHGACVRMFEGCLANVRGLVVGGETVEGEEEDVRRCRGYLKEHLEEAESYVDTFLGFEKRHQVIIERFGRYPHRNQVLGRESTKEEEEYLTDGGETFGTG